MAPLGISPSQDLYHCTIQQQQQLHYPTTISVVGEKRKEKGDETVAMCLDPLHPWGEPSLPCDTEAEDIT